MKLRFARWYSTSLFFILAMCAGCGVESLNNPPLGFNANDRANYEANRDQIVEINDVGIFAWWWPRRVVETGIDGDNPPPKDEYVQLTEWRYDGEGFTTSPHAVDLSASIENGSELPARLKMSVILKSKYARYDGLFTRNGDRWEYDMQKLEELPWAPNREIYSEGLVIEALESRKVGFKKFDLQPFLKSRENGNPPCLFQLEFRVTNQNQETFYGRSRMITVLLGD